MAFNFYGTYSAGQHLELSKFSLNSEYEIQDRIDYLNVLANRNGTFRTEFDSSGYPIKYTTTPGTYCDRLLRAFKAMGGKPEDIFIIREKSKPVYLEASTDATTTPDDQKTGFGQNFSNKRISRDSMRLDYDVGEKIVRLKKWQLQSIKFKLEHLEFKMKRALDYWDSLQSEIALLKQMQTDTGSSVGVLVSTTGPYVVNAGPIAKNFEDKHGLYIGGLLDKTIKSDYENAEADSLRYKTSDGK